METTFRDMYRNEGMASATEGTAPFHKLFHGVVTMGQVGYVAVFMVAIIAAIIACSVVFLKLYVASDGKGIAEQKQKLTRNLLLVFFLSILGGLVVWIYNTFLW